MRVGVRNYERDLEAVLFRPMSLPVRSRKIWETGRWGCSLAGRYLHGRKIHEKRASLLIGCDLFCCVCISNFSVCSSFRDFPFSFSLWRDARDALIGQFNWSIQSTMFSTSFLGYSEFQLSWIESIFKKPLPLSPSTNFEVSRRDFSQKTPCASIKWRIIHLMMKKDYVFRVQT